MLTCRARLPRCIRAPELIFPRGPGLRHYAHVSPRQRVSARASPRSTRRAAVVGTPAATGSERRWGHGEDNWKTSPEAAGLKRRETRGLTRRPDAPGTRKPDVTQMARKLGRRDPALPVKDWNRRRRELKHLTDPLELATFVQNELMKDKEEEMLQLVRMASHSMQCIVSWNHLIDYSLAKGKVSQAFKIYNEMKKRAQFPDSYTYSRLLRGLSNNAQDSGVLAKALSLYHSMSAENSRVEPSIIHTNSMLKVCVRSNDMDAMWGVAAKIPDKGPGSANGITYATILNGIRQNLLVNVPGGEIDEEVAVRKERGIVEGRRVWEEIISKWRSGDLVIEEELVCAMGRLLLIGARPRDWDDVLSLVEQTMNIPRLVPRLGTPARQEAGFPHLRAPNVPEDYKFDDDHLSPSKEPPRGSEFLPVTVSSKNSLSYAYPSNNTLSMVQEACQKIVAFKAADKYWDMLTSPDKFSVIPDINNVNHRLRVLRQNRASKKASDLIKFAVEKELQPRPGTFRIAMSTCVRDKNNPNSLENAGEILDTMMAVLEDADPKTVAMYAELAISSPAVKGKDLVKGLARLQPVIQSLRIQLGVGGPGVNGRVKSLVGGEREDALGAMRKVYGGLDRLVLGDLISEEEKRVWKAERARLSAFLGRKWMDREGNEVGGQEQRKRSARSKDGEANAGDKEAVEGAEEGKVGAARPWLREKGKERQEWSARKLRREGMDRGEKRTGGVPSEGGGWGGVVRKVEVGME